MNETNPCYGCEKRHVSCHSDCSLHKEWLAQYNERKQKIAEARKTEAVYSGYCVVRKQRIYNKVKSRHSKQRGIDSCY